MIHGQKPLNEKRLTAKQVQELIKSEGKLHEAYTAALKEAYSPTQNLVYELSGNRILYIQDPNGLVIPGKGDIYTSDFFEHYVEWRKRMRKDVENGRTSSTSHWRFYSKHGNDIINLIDSLITELASELDIESKCLNKSYRSLDVLSEQCRSVELDYLLTNLYDNIVVYVGEVMKARLHGYWAVNENHAGGPYPYISVGIKEVQHLPNNAVSSVFQGMGPLDFRKETANEIRRQASRLKYYRGDYSRK